ncbi:MAG: phage tail tape measure protein [Alphaproteobacteria bacterium]|nr:phage tail tape measure protein [Alphaproteobacteria bacterium]
MAVNLESSFKIIASVTGMDSVKELQKEIKSISTQSENASRGFALLGKASKVFLTGFVAFKGIEMVKDLAFETIALADEFNDLAQKVGVSATTLSAWSTSAGTAGVTVDTLAQSIKKFNINLVDAESNVRSGAAKAFGALGINIYDANGALRDSDKLILEVAKKFHNMEDGAYKTAIAVKLFGKNGADMIPFLNQGPEAIEKMNYAFSGNFIKLADQAGDSMTVLKGSFMQVTSQILEGILPSFNAMMIGFKELGKSTGDGYGLTELFRDGLVAVGEVARYVALGVMGIVQSVRALTTGINTLIEAGTAIFTKDTVAAALKRGGKRLAGVGNDFVSGATSLFSKESGSMTGRLFGMTDPKFNEVEPKKTGGSGGGIGENDGVDKWRDKIAKINAEAAAMKLSNLEREISVNLADLEASGINKGTKAYNELSSALTAALTKRARAKESKDLDDYLMKENQSIQLMQDEITYIGMSTIEVDKLKEARRIDLEYQTKSKDMTKEGAAELKAATEQIKNQRLALMQLNYEQQRTFQAGAAQAFNDYMESAKNAALGAKNLFTTAFKGMEDALVNFAMTGKLNFKDMARSIIADLIRIQVQQSLVSAIGGFRSAFSSIFSPQHDLGSAMPWLHANGGVMTSAGSIPLRAYSRGGVANNPQMAIFGEGSTPEAYVPLPDGRTIPVTLKGQGQTGDVMVNLTINNTGQGQESTRGNNKDGAELGKSLAALVKSMILKEMLPGGLLNRSTSQA